VVSSAPSKISLRRRLGSQLFVLLCLSLRLNTCPYQGSRTVRTEEAVLISLAQLSLPLSNSAHHKEIVEETPEVEFSDESPSDESSEGGESGSDDGNSENDEKFNDEK
jgi:hypothetical protein